jgi:cytochrome c-type biogenesis protein CcmH/NrfG
MPIDRIAQLTKFLASRPDDPFPRYALALEHRSRGDAASAIATLEELLQRAPTYVPSYLMLGQLLVSAGRQGDAAAALRKGQESARAAGDKHALAELTEALEQLE